MFFPRRQSHRRSNIYVYLLALQALQQFLSQPYTPPVTLAVIGLLAVLHIRPGTLDATLPTISEICLNPAYVVETRSLRRLVLSALFHADDAHLIFNSISFLSKGMQLERSLGSPRFAALLALLTVASQSLLVLTSRLLSDLAGVHGPYFNDCAVGFSGVIFALKAILDHDSPTYSLVGGVQVPTRLAAWAELLLIQLVVPNASFLGHLSGILAGLLVLHAPLLLPASLAPFLPRSSLLPPSWRSLWPFSTGRTFGSGRSGRAPPPPSTSSAGGAAGRGGRGESSRAAWSCPACTYDNDSAATRCAMCEQPRPGGHAGQSSRGREGEPPPRPQQQQHRHQQQQPPPPRGWLAGQEAQQVHDNDRQPQGQPTLEELRAMRVSRFQHAR